MIYGTITFCIQILIVLLVFFYIYYIFRNSIVIDTAEEYITKIAPGLQQLAETSDAIVFWFYSLSKKKYIKYILHSDMKIVLDDKAIAPLKVNDVTSGFYYNFGLQRWEKKTRLDEFNNVPHFDPLRKTIQQNFLLCHFTDHDDTEVCDEVRSQAFVKMKVANNTYTWNDSENILQLEIKNPFPIDFDIKTCMFTSSRYKFFLGVDNTDWDNNEILIGVYFERINDENGKSTQKWQLKECLHPNDMYFNGNECVYKERKNFIESNNNYANKTLKRKTELIKNTYTVSELKHKFNTNIYDHYLELENGSTIVLNVNVPEKRYPFESYVYKSCIGSIFIIGTFKNGVDKIEINKRNGKNYLWKLEQIIEIKELKKKGQHWCPLVMEPRQLVNISSGSIKETNRQFIIYRDKIFYVKSYLSDLMTKLNEINSTRTSTVGALKMSSILPHVRTYMFDNFYDLKCYATVIGETILDVFIDKRLLDDYLPNVHKYEFYNRMTFPIIEDDFLIDTWACAVNIENHQMFIYISLVDIYGLTQYATRTSYLP